MKAFSPRVFVVGVFLWAQGVGAPAAFFDHATFAKAQALNLKP